MTAVLRREMLALCGGALAWGAWAAFAALYGYLFYTNLEFFRLSGGEDPVRGFWQYQFQDARQLLLVFLPLLTMRSFADERDSGTLELLWSYPLSDRALVGGKFLAIMGVAAAMILGTVVCPLMWAFGGATVDWGAWCGGTLGLLLLAAAFAGLGLLVSAVARTALVAGAATFMLLYLLWILTWNQAAIPTWVRPALLAISVFERFYGFSLGVVESEDVVFFLSWTLSSLVCATLVLRRRNFRGWAG